MKSAQIRSAASMIANRRHTKLAEQLKALAAEVKRRGIVLGDERNRTPNGLFGHIRLDAVDVGVEVRGLKRQGLRINGLEIACNTTRYPYSDRVAIRGRGSGLLQIAGLQVWGAVRRAVVWDDGALQVIGGMLRNWEPGEPAIEHRGGLLDLHGVLLGQSPRGGGLKLPDRLEDRPDALKSGEPGEPGAVAW